MVSTRVSSSVTTDEVKANLGKLAAELGGDGKAVEDAVAVAAQLLHLDEVNREFAGYEEGRFRVNDAYERARRGIRLDDRARRGIRLDDVGEGREFAGYEESPGRQGALPGSVRFNLKLWDVDPEKELRGRSVKIGNLVRNLRSLGQGVDVSAVDVSAQVISAAVSIATGQPFLVLGAVLTIIGALHRGLTVELSKQEASVFWGLIQASGRDYIADRDAIVRHTNDERARWNMRALNEVQIDDTLGKLEDLGAIKEIPGQPGTWRIIEEFEIG